MRIEELKKLQGAFVDSQQKLSESLNAVKIGLQEMKNELSLETGKREQENTKMEIKLSGMERKIELINESNIRHDQSLISLKDEIRATKDDLKDEIRDLKKVVGDVDKMFLSIKTWTKILVGLLTLGGTILAGLATGVIQNFFK